MSKFYTFKGEVDRFRGLIDGKFTSNIEEGGLFEITQSLEIAVEITVTYDSGPQMHDDPIKSTMKIDFKNMKLTCLDDTDDTGLMFKSIDNFDNAKLRYYVKQKDALFVRYKQDAYI